MRVGTGFDAHRLVPGRPLVLGGVSIPHETGLAGHSDGDAVVHAIIDALLGAAALGDIGTHFSDHDPRYEGVSSVALLAQVNELLSQHGWRVRNVDATIVAERPRLASHVAQMRGIIGESLGLGPDKISIKATTTDGMGFTGNEEGIAAHAIITIESAT
jgi:2-C-methyl-D-erythritol 2,4-cyclodiphosphate synthase